MQLFSRNKALAALSLGALAALGACGDDVTVPVAPAAPVVISITPPSASMNVGESLNFAVQISGGSTTAAPTLASCTSSNAAVATATVTGSACRVTAVAAGNATVTAAASTGQVAAASIAVAAPAPAITGLAVSPSAAQLAVGGNVTIVPTVNRANASVNVAYTYTSSTTSVATVSAAGVVTAVAPGTATITVTAAGTGTGFSAATMTTAATITVSERAPGLTSLQVTPPTATLSIGGTQQVTAAAQGPRASAATLSYGTSAPSVATVSASGLITAVSAGTATITVTAQSTQEGAFAASSLTGLVAVTVSANAQVIINSLTQAGNPIDITNVRGQFEVNLQLQPNGQNVASVQAWVCENGETVAACAARSGSPAAQQTFGAAGALPGMIQLYVNSAEFATPDFTTGADANTLYKNGLKTIVATVTTAAGSSPTASNNLSSINFNNNDGWTISWQLPANRATASNGITWYGGPSTPDAMLPGAQSGEGSFTMVPVLYTPGRTINSMTASANGAGQGNLNCTPAAGIQATARPFRFTYGTRTGHTTTAPNNNFRCSSWSSANGWAPEVTASVDNNSVTGPTMTWPSAPTSGQSVFRAITGTGTGYYASLAYRPALIAAAHDYGAPTIARFEVKGGGAASVDSGWVNGSYAFNSTYRQPSRTADSARYLASDGGVGLLTSRNTVFDVCAVPTTIPTDAATTCTSPIASGGLTATISSIGLTESANLTNQAYFAVARETDRLGNRATTNPFSYTTSTGAIVKVNTATADTTTTRVTFGVDLTEPTLVEIPNSGANAIANFVRTDRDSIFGGGTPRFAVRFTDGRSGFPSCTAATCQTAGNQRAGTFQITRRMRPTLDSYTNDALVETMNNWEADATSNTITKSRSIDAGLFGGDNTIREFAVDYFGEAARAVQTTSAPTGEGAYQPGYYTFTGTLTDRAGNSITLPSRSVAMDQGTPVLNSINPRQLSSGSPALVDVTGTDDLEVIAGELSLTYPIGTVTFRRTPAMTATAKLGFWHNPFASITDNKLTTIIGNGTALGATPLQTPIPLLGQITQVNGANAPAAPAAIVGTGKPTAISARLFDIRSTVIRSATVGATQFADSGASNRMTATIGASQLANNTKNWTETSVVGYASPVGIQQWYMHDPENAGTAVEFRARTNSSVTNPPFSRVHILRRNANVPTEWEYVGDASYVNVLDQGGNRFFRWSFTGGASAQGQFNVAAIGDQDVLIAVGVDNAGIGLATQAQAMGVAPLPAVFTTETVVLDAALGQYRNTDAAITRTLSPSANPQSANLSYSCSSSNSTFMTAQMGQNGVCTLTPVGTVTAAAGVKVALTFTILGVPQNSLTHRAATITRTDTVVRLPDLAPVPAITSASISGTIPTTLLPGQTFQLTAVPSLAPGYGGTPTYNWTTAPVTGLSLTAGQGTATATYTWSATAASFDGSVTINAVVSAAAAAGFTSASATGTSGPTTVAGYTDQDASFGGALTPANSIINASSTLNLVMTPTGSSNPANTTLTACSSSNTAAATVNAAGVVSAAAVTQPDSTVITCTVSRTQNSFGGGNYAARGPVSTNSVRVNVVVPVPAISAVTVGGSIPATFAPGDSVILTATSTQPGGASAPTYTWDAAPTGFTATGLSTATAVYKWVGSQSRTAAALTINVSATAAASTGFTANTVTNNATNASVAGFWNTDTPWSLSITPSNATIDPTGGTTTTGVMAFTALFNSDPANTSYSCSTTSTRVSVTTAATGAYAVADSGLTFTTPQTDTISCVMTRTQHSYSGNNYAARSGTTAATATTTVTVIPRAIQSIAFGGTGSITVSTGNTVTVPAASYLTVTTAATPGALTYSIPAPGTVGAWGAPGVDPVVTINPTTGALTVNATGTTAGTYPITVNLAGAGAAGSSFGNNRTTTATFAIVITP